MIQAAKVGLGIMPFTSLPGKLTNNFRGAALE